MKDTNETAARPLRVQLRRTKGWRLPPNTVVVARPTKWGNPFRIGCYSGLFDDDMEDANAAVRCYERWLAETDCGRRIRAEAKRDLRGKHLACWCSLGEPCHADVLLSLANSADTRPPP